MCVSLRVCHQVSHRFFSVPRSHINDIKTVATTKKQQPNRRVATSGRSAATPAMTCGSSCLVWQGRTQTAIVMLWITLKVSLLVVCCCCDVMCLWGGHAALLPHALSLSSAASHTHKTHKPTPTTSVTIPRWLLSAGQQQRWRGPPTPQPAAHVPRPELCGHE